MHERGKEEMEGERKKGKKVMTESRLMKRQERRAE